MHGRLLGGSRPITFLLYMDKTMKKKKYEYRAPKPALNVVRQITESDSNAAVGMYQVYQLYCKMTIPLLGRRSSHGFVEMPAKSISEAFSRLETEYYE
jgi:hypothetical protein